MRNNLSKQIPVANKFKIGGDKLSLFAGPCQIESKELCLEVAETLIPICESLDINLVFKSSFDKANRTSLNSERGFGLEQGLKILAEIKEETNLPIISDIHLPEQAEAAAHVLDIIQIPAFLARQTDLLVAAGKTGKTIHIKKAQFMKASDMKFSAEKVSNSGSDNILLCERGTSFGYGDLVVDMRNLIIMRKLGYPVIFDATHSVQKPGSGNGTTGGNREYVPYLAKAAIATGIDGLFIETHPNPDNAPSDGPNMIPLKDMPQLLEELSNLWNSTRVCT